MDIKRIYNKNILEVGKAIWLFGLSGSGKTTLSKELAWKIEKCGQKTILLDGDIVRKGINNNLGFSKLDRIENVRRIAEICKLMLPIGVTPIVSVITPYESAREMIIDILGRKNVILVFLECSLIECEKRDPKNLYKQARKGKIKNFTGISDAFEMPNGSVCRVKTENRPISICLEELWKVAIAMPFLAKKAHSC